MTDSRNNATPDKIAIIGIGCRLPGSASDHRAFWQNLINGEDCITRTPADRYDVTTLGSRDKAKRGRLVGGRGGYIDGFDEFDPAFFGISPREAAYMDPQQRKLLEVAWEALEDGGQKPAELAGQDVGVFVGAFTLDYKILQFADLSFDTLAAHTATGTMMTMVSNRISYCFDFRGPSVSIDTACSSSLVAVHLACQSLRRGETSLALAGGTLLHMTPQYTIAETKGGFLSPEGSSRAFDAMANGYVRAEGVCVVALKRLEDSLHDGDPIDAVIIGSGVNQNGRTSGITVPNPDAQVNLIERTCAEAGIEPGSLQYIEAHGTSTPVGDPIEANALSRALSIGRKPGAKCYVGSVKANIGHTESAAGIAGLIKTVLCLQHQKIPPHINLERINPDIDLASAPYEIPTQLTDWPEHEGLARAGVNSFGFGGTNAHVLLEEAPVPCTPGGQPPPVPRLRYNILPLTAHDAAVLPELVKGIRQELAGVNGTAVSLPDLGYTLAQRRQHLPVRLSIVYSSRASLDERLGAYLQGEAHPHVLFDRQRDGRQRLVWVCTGMGPQWWAMGRQLFESEPVYRAMVERCDHEIGKLTGWSLVEELGADESSSRMSETWLAQPANFAVQLGLAALWRAYGVHPDAIVGHSTGEVAAFYEAGVYTLRDAVKVVVHRSRLQQKLVGTGTMLAASLSQTEATRRVAPYRDRVSVAAVNSPTAITFSGDEDALAQLATELQAEQIFTKFLTVRVPYHSPQMESIKDELLSSLSGLQPRATQVPLYLTGKEGVAHGNELDAGYWWHNVRDSVRFHSAIDRLIEDSYCLFLEIGPHPVLGHSIQECLEARKTEGRSLPSIRRQEDEVARVAMSLATLHNLGVDIAWNVLHPPGKLVTLPRYPFKRDRYWVEPKPVEQVRLGQLDHPLLGRRLANAEPTWEAKLDIETMPYLRDHRIQGNVVFPAAGYLEMATQAMRAMTGGGEATLAEVELRKALFIPEDESTTVQLSFSSEGAVFTIATVPKSSTERNVHASGVLRVSQRCGLSATLDSLAIRARSERHLDRASCYSILATMGYHYGPAFQAIEEVWIGPDEALTRIHPTGSLGDDAARYHMHPALLDACFQSLLTPQILGQPAGSDDGGVRLPLSIEEVRVDPLGNQPLWVHATVLRRDASELVGDIALYTDGGAPLGQISGFRAADIEKIPTTVSRGTIDSWLAELTWADKACGHEGEAASDVVMGEWLVFADAQGIADELVTLITARGGRCHLVRPGREYWISPCRRESTVAPGCAADLTRLLAALDKDRDAARRTIVHLWNLDLPPIDATSWHELGQHKSSGTYSLIVLAQSLLASSLLSEQADNRLYIVTRGTQAVVDGDVVEPLGAPAWGIGRVLWYQELSAHRGKLIDLDPAYRGGTPGDEAAACRAEAQALLREVLVNDEDEIALRGDRRYTSRLTPVTGLTRPLPLRLRADGSYIVTGAFGALGRLLCRKLVMRGARRLILIGRTRLPERSQWHEIDPDTTVGRNVRFLKELEALGAQLILATLDITDEVSLAAWLQEHRQDESLPIRGVFHLAGQVRDTLVAEMDRQSFDTAHDPKVIGAYLLHHHLRDEPLEHFVLFSSIASLLTTAGQTNYAAGNAFLDALAHYRRARGLPALSIDWGPWATGMIKELGLIEHYRNNRGMSSLSPDAGMAVLERVIGQNRAQLLVATIIDWAIFLAWYASPPPLLTEFTAAVGDPSQDSRCQGSSNFLDAFRNADQDTRQLLVTERLTAMVASVLRVSTEQVNPAVSLNTLGLDSLLAMELRTQIRTDIGIAVPVVTLLSRAPISDLIAQVHNGVADLVKTAAGEGGDAAAIEVFSDEQQYPLTQNQQALWFLKQLHPDGFAYNIGGAVEVRIELDPKLMFDAVRALIGRHPSLRANFMLEDGRAVQKISSEMKPNIALFDVQDKDWDDIYKMIIREYRKPYDLGHDPLVRFRLFKRGKDRWVVMKAVHHIISDAVSTFTFIEELLAIYEGLRQGREIELPPVAATYLDFLNWQNHFLASRDAQQMLDYWRNHLPTEIPVLNLPTDKPRPIVQTHNGASEFFVLDAALNARVHALAREHHVTVFMVLLSAYYILLHRYCGQDDIIIGSPVTGRTREEFASVYGYFVNPLPLHVNLAGEPSISQLMEQVRATVLGGLDNQEYPFVLLVDKLNLQHDPSRSAVFQAMFILLVHKVVTEKYGYRLDYIELPEEEGQFDLTLSAYEDKAEQRFHCVFKYNTDLFLPETIRRLASHYVNLLDALTSAPAAQPITQLEMLGSQERANIIGTWSGALRRVAYDLPVHKLISKIAAERPDAIAVSLPSAVRQLPQPGAGEPWLRSLAADGTQRLTYAALERRSSMLAGQLRALGVGGGAVVGLCLDKSPELIITLLAVLKAGGAYLPLDPEYPTDRLTYMVHNASATLVIVGKSHRERLGRLLDRVLTLDDLRQITDQHTSLDSPGGAPSSHPDVAIDMEAPAYVIYTSGSTGRPKAVQVSHRNLASAYSAWREQYRLDHDLHAHLQMANFSFDVFTGDLVRALCSGSNLVLINREVLFNTAHLYQTMLAEQVDCAEFVPTVIRCVMSYCEQERKRLEFMRLLIIGSDTWKVEEYQRLREFCGPETRLINSYGLTEATVDSSYFEGPTDGLEPSQIVPIGRPFPNSTLYILDEYAQPVPAGVPGELWIGGDGVATGYARDLDQTGRRFVTLTLSREPDAQPARLYRTGDIARWNSQGQVQLLGRIDEQIKLRGHRIEISEIESQLAADPELEQVLVTVGSDTRGDTALCAYYVPATGTAPDWRELRRHLTEYLPTFMIPSYFIELPELPLTCNGKIDLASLPALHLDGDEQAYEAPMTLFEVRMAEYWKSLLGLEQVGLRHDFFEVGGSSIKLIELIYHLQNEFNITIPVSQLFTVTTLHGMARTVEHIITGRIAGSRPYLQFNIGQDLNVSQRQTIVCFPPAGGHGLVYRQFAAHLPEYPFVAFNYLADNDKATRYADLIESIQIQDPCALFGYSLGGNIAFEVAKELERRGRNVPNVIIMDSYRIPKAFELHDEYLETFTRELSEHLRKHTGSEVVAQETLGQAREYIHFCSRTPNVGSITAPVSVISDENKVALYAAGEHGSWHGSSRSRTTVLGGSGTHADMLDAEHIGHNANLVRHILMGGQTRVA